MTSNRCRCDVMTSHRHQYDVNSTSCGHVPAGVHLKINWPCTKQTKPNLLESTCRICSVCNCFIITERNSHCVMFVIANCRVLVIPSCNCNCVEIFKRKMFFNGTVIEKQRKKENELKKQALTNIISQAAGIFYRPLLVVSCCRPI